MRISVRVALGTLIVSGMLVLGIAAQTTLNRDSSPNPAPASFDGRTNGMVSQTIFEADRELFEEKEEIDEGLGPVYNAPGCADCHGNPIVGGTSQVSELRVGHFDGTQFNEHPGGSLIHDRAINAAIQERLLPGYEVRAPRMSVSTLGDGFIEAIADSTLISIMNAQPPNMRGTLVRVPVLEAPGTLRVGRFGWKNQHASLESFAADAYLNEMGITSPLQPTENTSNGNSVETFDDAPDPEDEGADVRAFAEFMRATKAPPRDEALGSTADAVAGFQIFKRIDCDTCHVATIVTAPTGTSINGGAFTVPPALGNKIIHPFSDFLLHNVGTGDGIVQNGGPATRNKMRTPPLWGLRTRGRLMHDGESYSFVDAILRHDNEASGPVSQFRSLAGFERRQLLLFLSSL